MAFVDSSDWGVWCVLSDYRKLRKLDIRAFVHLGMKHKTKASMWKMGL